MVAEQGTASFTIRTSILFEFEDGRRLMRRGYQVSQDTDPLTQKTTAGRGNAVNRLEFSPATTELSKHFEDTIRLL
jgi:hypothetical protein